MVDKQEHFCDSIDFPVEKFLHLGIGKGRKILIIGESLPKEGWRKNGKAFYGNNGKLLPSSRNLKKLFNEWGINLEDCSFTEIAKCYIGKDRKILKDCSNKCWPIFLNQIKTNDFRILMPMGLTTLEIFNKNLGTNIKIGEIENIKIENKIYKILPIYHASPINPNNYQKNIKIFKENEKSIFSH